MRANRELRLAHRKHPDADQVELVEIASGEVVLFWDVARPDARRFVGDLKRDLAALETEDLLAKWSVLDD